MDLRAKQALTGFVFLGLVFAECFFLSVSGASLEVLTGFDFGAIFSAILSQQFILFALLLPLPYALAAVLSKKFEQKELSIAVVGGALLGVISSILVFSNLSGYAIAMLAYAFSFLLVIEIVYIKRAELKKWVWLRTLSVSVSKGAMITGAGLLIAVLLFTLPNNEASAEKFEDYIFDMVAENVLGNENQQDAAALGADIQKKALGLLTENKLFRKLETKEDLDVIAFVAMVNSVKEQLENPEQFSNSAAQEQDVKEQLKDSINIREMVPFYGVLIDWLWLIQTLAVFGLFALYKGIVAVPLGIAYGLVLEKAIK